MNDLGRCDIEAKACETRQALLSAMANLVGWQLEWRLPKMPAGCERAKAALACPEYDIVVCGEVKRGKSSFINALIGKPHLPTGVRETTSQVFRIAQAETESFALVFADGHREPIARADLDRYGSQTASELEGTPLLRGRVLRWIEVNTPAVFLPPGVRLVDTPGLGALYASHSEITNRYVLNADAVVFVLDSDQPLTQPEKRFLEKVFAITPNVLFIQTKIDTKDEAAWQAILTRNETLLNEAFGKKDRPAIRVYPVSSALLSRAANEADGQERVYLVEDSLFEKAREGLDNVIYRAVGWSRSAWAAAESARYVHTVIDGLTEQQQVVVAETAAEKAALRQKKGEVRSHFQKEWGAEGGKRTRFMAEVDRVLHGLRQEACSIGVQGTPLCTRMSDRINTLPDRSAAATYAGELPELVQAGVEQEWRELVVEAQKRIASLDEDLAMTADGAPPLRIDLPRVTLKDPSVWDRVKATNIDGMIGGGLAAIVADIFLTGGFATMLTVAGSLLGGAQGFSRISSQQLDAAKSELRQQLHALLAQCRNALCTPDIRRGQAESRLDAFLREVRVQVEAGLDEQYSGKRAQLEQEEARLLEQAALTGRRRDEELLVLQERMKAVKETDVRIQSCIQDLRAIQAELDRQA